MPCRNNMADRSPSAERLQLPACFGKQHGRPAAQRPGAVRTRPPRWERCGLSDAAGTPPLSLFPLRTPRKPRQAQPSTLHRAPAIPWGSSSLGPQLLPRRSRDHGPTSTGHHLLPPALSQHRSCAPSIRWSEYTAGPSAPAEAVSNRSPRWRVIAQ